MGVAVQSHWFSVGSIVPWAEAGVRAIATQAFTDGSFGVLGLDQIRVGPSAPDVLAGLLAADAGRERRQVAMVDSAGRLAAHTGTGCIPAAGHFVGDGFSAQSSMARTDAVWTAVARAFESASGVPAERLHSALEAGEEARGDIRGKRSVALVVVRGTSSGKP